MKIFTISAVLTCLMASSSAQTPYADFTLEGSDGIGNYPNYTISVPEDNTQNAISKFPSPFDHLLQCYWKAEKVCEIGVMWLTPLVHRQRHGRLHHHPRRGWLRLWFLRRRWQCDNRRHHVGCGPTTATNLGELLSPWSIDTLLPPWSKWSPWLRAHWMLVIFFDCLVIGQRGELMGRCRRSLLAMVWILLSH